MTDAINTHVAAFCHSQNNSGSIPVPTIGITAVEAPENSFTQRDTGLGSRPATRTGHRRVRGLNQHHLPASPTSSIDKLPLRSTDGCICSLASHGRLRQELRREVFDCNQFMLRDNAFDPHPSVMHGLPGSPLAQLRNPQLRGATTTGTPLSAGESALRFRQLRRTAFAMPEMGQIKVWVGCGCCDGHTPVDPDTTSTCVWCGFDLAAHHERGIPVPERIPVHPNGRRVAGQLPMPHHRNHDALGQQQTTIRVDAETTGCVFERGQRLLPRLHSRAPATFHPKRMVQRLSVSAQHLLLNILRTSAQPRIVPPCSRQQLRQPVERRAVARTLLVDSFVPQEPAPMPLRLQRSDSQLSRPQPVAVPNRLLHPPTVRQGTDIHMHPFIPAPIGQASRTEGSR